MAGIYSGSSQVTISGTYKDTSRDLTIPTTPIALPYADTWAAGSTYRFYEDTITLVANTPQNFDLYGSLVDMYGDTLSFALIAGLFIKNKSTTSGEDLEISGNFVTGSLLADWVDDAVKLLVEPGGLFLRTSPTDGYAVTDTTKERITLDPLTNGFTVDMVIWGTE